MKFRRTINDFIEKFPDGFTYDKQNKLVLTFRTNILSELTRSISNTLVEIKNGDPIKSDQISALVTHLVEKCNFYKDLEGGDGLGRI